MRKLFILFSLFISPAGAQTSVQQWRDSLATLSALIARQPTSTDLRLRKAAVNIELAQWQYAVDEYARVLSIDSCSLPALFFRAYAHNQLRQHQLACADYEHFLRLLPRHFEARLSLAVTLQTMGKGTEAVEQLNRLVDMFPDSATAYAARADVERSLGMHEPALYDLDQALRLQPSDADATQLLLAKFATLCALRRHSEARRLEQQLIARGVPRATIRQLWK